MYQQSKHAVEAQAATPADGPKTEGSNPPPGRDAAVTTPSLSLPKGGGAIRGIGEKFTANPVTGTASLTVPIPTSSNRSEFGPTLALSYDSGSGNGPFGFGWSLSLPAITRKTDRGLPRYEDEDESDTFILTGSEDLVPVLVDINGELQRHQETRTADETYWRIERYRPRVEGLFARIERWTNLATGDIHWRSITQDNITSRYGASPESRIADPADSRRVFSWLICETYDDCGNAVFYHYRSEDSTGVDTAQAHERNRTVESRSAGSYLKQIRYGNRTPRQEGEDLAQRTDWMFEVVLDYGEHEADAPTPNDMNNWLCRHDPFSSYRAGFEVRTYRVCQRVLMFHHFPDETAVGANCLVRSTDFAYRNLRSNPGDEGKGDPTGTFLSSVTQAGYRRASSGYRRTDMPPIEFEYSLPTIDDAIRDIDEDSLTNMPVGVDDRRWQWLDLDSEGSPGVLARQGNGWYYKRNLSPLSVATDGHAAAAHAQFEAVRPVECTPSLADGIQFLDLASDGSADAVQLSEPIPGFYEREPGRGWTDFIPFRSMPRVQWSDTHLRLIDLTGDGHADILIPEDEAFTWHPSLAEAGFGPGLRVPLPVDEKFEPSFLFSNGVESVHLADFTGDGLSDLVRIRNGEVCYWPNLGYGRFGPRIVMDEAPWFDAPDQFDQRRIRLGDIDGSGATDIVYFAREGAYVYFNESGNRWSPARVISHAPQLDTVNSVDVIDLLGNGTACLVWSSPLTEDGRCPMRYIDLMGGQKPHLLTRFANNLGAETHIRYAPSTRFYLEDRRRGCPWVTRLPFPVQVVERVETHDRVSGNRFVTRFAYHHGCFDGVEREFRGFGMVEQWDTEEFGVLTEGGKLPASNVDSSSHVPPVLTRTWFHTGVYTEERRISRVFADEYWSEPGLDDDDQAAMLLSDTEVPAGLTVQEEREAVRALKGAMLRQEVFGLDGSPASGRPYSVAERNYTIRLLQPEGPNYHAVFLTHDRETIDFHYERVLYKVDNEQCADPRVHHEITLAVDDFGNVLRSVAVGYGRRHEDPDTLLNLSDRAKQAQILLMATVNDHTNSIDTGDAWRVPQLCDTRSYELLRVRPTASRNNVTNLFEFEEIGKRLTEASDGVHDLDFSDILAAGAIEDHPYRRLVEQRRIVYRADSLDNLLPLGELEPFARTGETYTLAFTADLLDAVFQRNGQPLIANPTALLGDEAGYLSSADLRAAGLFPAADVDDQWWIPSGRIFYSPDPAPAATQELAFARQHFFLTHRILDPFGQESVFTYDGHDLGMTQTRDALGSIVQAQYDYRVVQPSLVTDANGNRSAAAFDSFGLITATALMGKASSQEGDLLDGFDPDVEDGALATHLDDPLADPHLLLGQATTRILHDRHAYLRTRERPQPQPVVGYSIAREVHESDLPSGAATPVQVTFTYMDGFGREIQRKAQAEPGPLHEGGPTIDPRWVGTGWTIFNNKGKTVRQYEPFLTDTHKFELDPIAGVSPTFFYDPLQRVTGTLHSHHCYEKVRFDPWRQEAWDSADTATVMDPAEDPDIGDHFRRLPDTDYLPTWHSQRITGALGMLEQRAAAATAMHAETPTVTLIDSLARPFAIIMHNRFEENGVPIDELLVTRSEIDTEGRQLALTDALGRRVGEQMVRMPGSSRTTRFANGYDVAGTMLYQLTMDAGARWILTNAAGNIIRSWDSGGYTVRTTYDALQRPVCVFVQGSDNVEILAVRTVYGEGQDGTANHQGRVFQQFDAAGLVTHEAYDFKGNLLRSSRQFTVEYQSRPNWSTTPALEAEMFITTSAYDALNRVTASTLPDGTVVRATLNQSNLLERLEANPGGGAMVMFISGVEYDAKGQRTAVDYGNGARTTYTYDPVTLLPTRIHTRRNGDNVQDLQYTFDAVANPTSVRDNAQQAVFFRNHRVDPSNDYTYDALYQLRNATGREHLGQIGNQLAPPTPNGPTDAPRTSLLHPGDGKVMGSWTERYRYDVAGNLVELLHRGTDPAHPGWTRMFVYGEGSLIEPAETGNRLSSSTVGAATSNYTYNAHGGMASMPHLSTIGWDYRNQIERVDLGGGGTAWYVYDANGERVRKVINRQNGTRQHERRYLPAFEVYSEYNGAGSAITLERTTVHVIDSERRVALVETRTHGNDGSPTQLIRYQFANQVGASSIELDDIGQVISYEEYYPWGRTSYQAVRAGLDANPKRFRFIAKEHDEESGLYHLGARYYAPWLARWVSTDPNGFEEGPNLYRYARNNPVLYRDTEGADSSADQVIYALNQFRQQDPDRFLVFLAKNEAQLYPLLQPYGYTGCWVDEGAYLRDFDSASVRWSQATGNRLPPVMVRIVELNPNEVILDALPDGTGYIGPRYGFRLAYDRQVVQRFLRTGNNIRGGLFGAIGYGLGGDAGSDLGAAFDGLASATAGTARARAHNQAISSTPPPRPTVTSSAPSTTREGNRLTSTTGGRSGGGGGSTPPSPPGNQSGLRTNGQSAAEQAELQSARTSFNLPAAPTASNTRIVGVLVTESGERIPMHSGQFGGPSGGTHRGSIPRGPGSGFSRHTLTHIEGHAAAIMHQRGIQSATLLIEKAPCQACDNPTQTPNISAMLPRGARLTVVDPHSATTYTSSQR